MKNYKRDYFNPEDSGIGFLAGVAVPQLVLLLLAIVVIVVASVAGVEYEELSKTTTVTYIAMALSEASFFLVYLVLFKYRKVEGIGAAGLKKGINLKSIPIIICLGIVLTLFFSPIVSVIDHLISLTGYQLSSELTLPLSSFWQYLLAVVLMVALPAFCEEVLFRGVVLNGLRRFGMWPAILISALFFMLMHANIQQTVYTFFLGVVLGFVVYKTKSLWAGIIIHFINNFMVVTSMYFAKLGWLDSSTPTIDGAFIAYAFGACAIGGGLVWLGMYLLNKFNKNNNSGNIIENMAEASVVDTMAVTAESPSPNLAPATKDRSKTEVAEAKIPLKELFNSKLCVTLMAAGLGLAVFMWVLDFVSKLS